MAEQPRSMSVSNQPLTLENLADHIIAGDFGPDDIHDLMNLLDKDNNLDHIGPDYLSTKAADALMDLWRAGTAGLREAIENRNHQVETVANSPASKYVKKMLALLGNNLSLDTRTAIVNAIADAYGDQVWQNSTKGATGAYRWVENIIRTMDNVESHHRGYNLAYQTDSIFVAPSGAMLMTLANGKSFEFLGTRPVVGGYQMIKFVKLQVHVGMWSLRAINFAPPSSDLKDIPTGEQYVMIPDPDNPGKRKKEVTRPRGRWVARWGCDAIFFQKSQVPMCTSFDLQLAISGTKIPMQSFRNQLERAKASAKRSPDPADWKDLPPKEIAFLEKEGRVDMLEGNRRNMTGYQIYSTPFNGCFEMDKSFDSLSGRPTQGSDAIWTSKMPVQNCANPLTNEVPTTVMKRKAFLNTRTVKVTYQTHHEMYIGSNCQIESTVIDPKEWCYELNLGMILSPRYVWVKDPAVHHDLLKQFMNFLPVEDKEPDDPDIGNVAVMDPMGQMQENEDNVNIFQPRRYVNPLKLLPQPEPTGPVEPAAPVPKVPDSDLADIPKPDDKNTKMPDLNMFSKMELMTELCKAEAATKDDPNAVGKCLQKMDIRDLLTEMENSIEKAVSAKYGHHPFASYDPNHQLASINLDSATDLKKMADGYDYHERFAENLASKMVTWHDHVNFVVGSKFAEQAKTASFFDCAFPCDNDTVAAELAKDLIPATLEDTPLYQFFITGAGSASPNFTMGVEEGLRIPYTLMYAYLKDTLEDIRFGDDQNVDSKYRYRKCVWNIFSHLDDDTLFTAHVDSQMPDFWNIFNQRNPDATTLNALKVMITRRCRAIYDMFANLFLFSLMNLLGTKYAKDIETDSQQTVQDFAMYFKMNTMNEYFTDLQVEADGSKHRRSLLGYCRSYVQTAYHWFWPACAEEHMAIAQNPSALHPYSNTLIDDAQALKDAGTGGAASPQYDRTIADRYLLLKIPLGSPKANNLYWGQYIWSTPHWTSLTLLANMDLRGYGTLFKCGGDATFVDISNVNGKEQFTILQSPDLWSAEKWRMKIGYYINPPLSHFMGADFYDAGESGNGGRDIRQAYRLTSTCNVDEFVNAFLKANAQEIVSKTGMAAQSFTDMRNDTTYLTKRFEQDAMKRNPRTGDILMRAFDSATPEEGMALTSVFCATLAADAGKTVTATTGAGSSDAKWLVPNSEIPTVEGLFAKMMDPASKIPFYGLTWTYCPRFEKATVPEIRPRASRSDNYENIVGLNSRSLYFQLPNAGK